MFQISDENLLCMVRRLLWNVSACVVRENICSTVVCRFNREGGFTRTDRLWTSEFPDDLDKDLKLGEPGVE